MNRAVYVVDASGSMNWRTAQAAKLVMASVGKLEPGTLVSIVTFEECNVDVVCKNVSVGDVRFDNYKTGGLTNLLDAVSDGCDLIKSRGSKDTYCVFVLTDGGENSSRRVTGSQLVEKLAKLQSTDRWTLAWLVPPECVASVKGLGIDASNIFGWTDIKVAAEALSRGMDTLSRARSRGETCVSAGFFSDLSGVKKADVRATMTLLDEKTYTLVQVTRKDKLPSIVKRVTGKQSGIAGLGYYELTMPEIVQANKQILVIDRRRPNEVFSGGRGVLGLPDGSVKVTPKDHGNYRIFVMSRSNNRDADPGTTVVVRDTVDLVR